MQQHGLIKAAISADIYWQACIIYEDQKVLSVKFDLYISFVREMRAY